MKVRELVDQLNRLDPEMEVVGGDFAGSGGLEEPDLALLDDGDERALLIRTPAGLVTPHLADLERRLAEANRRHEDQHLNQVLDAIHREYGVIPTPEEYERIRTATRTVRRQQARPYRRTRQRGDRHAGLLVSSVTQLAVRRPRTRQRRDHRNTRRPTSTASRGDLEGEPEPPPSRRLKPPGVNTRSSGGGRPGRSERSAGQ